MYTGRFDERQQYVDFVHQKKLPSSVAPLRSFSIIRSKTIRFPILIIIGTWNARRRCMTPKDVLSLEIQKVFFFKKVVLRSLRAATGQVLAV